MEIPQTLVSFEKAMAATSITSQHCLEAIVGCYVVIHGKTLERGAHLIGKNLADGEAERLAYVSACSVLQEAGVDLSALTVNALRSMKEALDERYGFVKVDEDLRALHDKVCAQLLEKIQKEKS